MEVRPIQDADPGPLNWLSTHIQEDTAGFFTPSEVVWGDQMGGADV